MFEINKPLDLKVSFFAIWVFAKKTNVPPNRSSVSVFFFFFWKIALMRITPQNELPLILLPLVFSFSQAQIICNFPASQPNIAETHAQRTHEICWEIMQSLAENSNAWHVTYMLKSTCDWRGAYHHLHCVSGSRWVCRFRCLNLAHIVFAVKGLTIKQSESAQWSNDISIIRNYYNLQLKCVGCWLLLFCFISFLFFLLAKMQTN